MNGLQLKKKETRKITNGYYEGRKNALGLTGADCCRGADQVPNLKCIEETTSPYSILAMNSGGALVSE